MGDQEHYQMYIGGEWLPASSGQTFEAPIRRQATSGQRCRTTADDVDRAVQAAHKAFTEGPWSTMTPTARGKLLRRLAAKLAEHSEELGRIETVDTGKLFKETRWQANYIAEFFQYYAGLADKISGETLPIDKPDMLTMTLREPLGVVAAVVPWNSQLFLVAVKIGPALAAGNTVVLKASEHASAPMLAFAKVFEEAGFPRCFQRCYRLWRSLWKGVDHTSACGSHQLHRWAGNSAPRCAQLRRELRPGLTGVGWKVAHGDL